jgi:hypothetical protein
MSSIKVTNLQAPSAASPAIVLASDGSATAQLSSLNGGALSGARNRIINGDMRIDQRNAGASVTITTTGGGQYTLDRWFGQASQSSKFSVQRNAGSVTPPTGFTNYLSVTSLSAYSVTSGDYFSIKQSIEGFNGADLAFGTANAATVTMSFRVYSSLTGTFGGVLQNGAFNRSYPFTYAISSANTWTTVSVTIPGDTSGTWATDNSSGLVVIFGLGVGSTYSGTAGSWSGNNYISATGGTSVVGTNGATFYITGVQLEAGSVATPFERRSYGQELALCQRYYFKTFAQGTAPAQNVSANNLLLTSGTSNYVSGIIFPVAMRTAPSTITTFNPFAANANFRVPGSATDITITGSSGSDWGITNFGTSGATAPFNAHAHFTASAEL